VTPQTQLRSSALPSRWGSTSKEREERKQKKEKKKKERRELKGERKGGKGGVHRRHLWHGTLTAEMYGSWNFVFASAKN